MENNIWPLPVSYRKLPVIKDSQKLKTIIVKSDDPFENLLKYNSDPNSFNSHSDVWLLTNLNRLNMANPTEVARMIDERFKERSVSNPYANMSDEDIFNTIKSKNIQSASELSAWVDYLSAEQTKVRSEIDKLNTSNDTVEVSDVE